MNAFSAYHRRYIFRIAAIILFSSVVIISLNFYSIKILSSIRAYVNGESEYSKAQKEATRYLIDFIQTSDKRSYDLFKEEIKVPIGDSLARVALQADSEDDDVIIRAALQGRNHPDDIKNMIWMFRNFQQFSFFKNVLQKWEEGDRDIAELDKIGQFIYNLKSQQLNPSVKTALILKVNTINRRLTYNQQAFTSILGEASRVIARTLTITNIFLILMILFSTGIFARNTFKQLEESRRLIIAQNNAKDEFMSIASHELKTPLTSMKASLQILERFSKQSEESKQMHPFVVNANKQVNRLTGLVNELLDVTRIQSGKLTITKKPFLLNELVKEVIQETTQTSTHAYIINDFGEVFVNADPTRIYQVIDNFLSNAAKYSPEGKEVHIWSEIEANQVKVCIKDFGPGIAKSKLPFLFDRFYRIEETNHTAQGLGLGLYICKEIIENHGGRIGAESEMGQGSTFWFSLPSIKMFNASQGRVDETQLSRNEPSDSNLPV
ncbi:sensor histidine kinase [Paradesertivirga mongoliensis]|uniref:histidine kinase n=1 Tax=Paradesertivirga mongoliensis TaxID=2100740 RepID=A0ABW4ZP28_9SPHI|nr:ATP-binding protein [Pedobacter mongoliensis]